MLTLHLDEDFNRSLTSSNHTCHSLQ